MNVFSQKSKKSQFLVLSIFILIVIVIGVSITLMKLRGQSLNNQKKTILSNSVNSISTKITTKSSPNLMNIQRPRNTTNSFSSTTESNTSKENIVVVAVGDIACDPSANKGTLNNCDQNATANLAISLKPDAVLTLGDTQYETNTLNAFYEVFDKSWGKLKDIIHPAIGNHEYLTSGAQGYFDYFGAAAGNPTEGYYSFDIGTWHFISINSECSEVGGCKNNSKEELWLQQDLATHSNLCTIAYWHEPRWSSGEHGDAKQMDTIWKQIAVAHVDIVLSGHNHDYERFLPLDMNGNPSIDGVTEFVVGTGGKNHYGFNTPPLPGEVVRDSASFGVLKLVLHNGYYDWQFVSVPGSPFNDFGTAKCN
jgi:hypothetical protein